MTILLQLPSWLEPATDWDFGQARLTSSSKLGGFSASKCELVHIILARLDVHPLTEDWESTG